MSIPGEIWSVDTEWGFHDGRIDHESAWEPVVLCLVGLRSGRRLSFWGRDPGLPAFFRDHAGDQYLAHSSVAEMKYLLRLGIPLPTSWFDTFVAWRRLTNRPGNLEAGLSAALCRLGLPHLAPAAKEALRQKILHLDFDPDSAADRAKIIDYCFSDCDGPGALYERVAGRIDSVVMAHWVEYHKAVARMELRGIPFDVEAHGRIQMLRPRIGSRLIGDVNETWPVFRTTQRQNGKLKPKGNTTWTASLNQQSFLRWCRRQGIDWPVTISSKTGNAYHSFNKDVMKEMEARHPFIAEIRQVGKTLDQFERHVLAFDPVLRRHYYSTWTFRSVIGRNQPRDFVFTAPKWMRWLIIPVSPDHVLVYVDFVAQEVGIATALSGDPVMRAIYEADDCHMAFAIRAGAAPTGATKKTHSDTRKAYKTVNLGMQYGQTAFGIARRLGVSYAEAEALVAAHRDLFPAFWNWSERTVQGAYDRGWISTPCGWRSKVPFPSNERSWMNWPVQSTGADIMRLVVTYLDRQGVHILAPVHDGFLLSCRRSQLADLRAAVDYACGTAVEHVLPGFPLRWDFTVHESRFEDEDGAAMWERIWSIVKEEDSHVVCAP